MAELPSIYLADAEKTRAAGRALAKRLLERFEDGGVGIPFLITLKGDLGAGKTTFVQGLAQALGVPPEAEVLSPTFTLANEYLGFLPIFHLDLYRLRESEFMEAGLDEYLDRPGLALVEWPERMGENFWPLKRLDLVFTFNDEGGRDLVIAAPSSFLLREFENL